MKVTSYGTKQISTFFMYSRLTTAECRATSLSLGWGHRNTAAHIKADQKAERTNAMTLCKKGSEFNKLHHDAYEPAYLSCDYSVLPLLFTTVEQKKN